MGQNHDDVSGLPFVGAVGANYCYAVDYPELWDQFNAHTTSYIGGLFHELGHGFGLSHNGDITPAVIAYVTSLMGTGNSSYGKSATHTSGADCNILATDQCFSALARTDWYAEASVQVNSIKATVDANNNMIISGKYTSNRTVMQVIYYNDPGTYDSSGNMQNIGVNKDYDASAFGKAPINTDSFYISIPYSQFGVKHDGPHQLKIRFQQENGSFSTFGSTTYYKVVNGVSNFSSWTLN